MSAAAMLRDERGAVAILTALLLPVLVGLGGFAVDLGHHRLVHARLQSAADAGALAAAQELNDQAAARAAGVRFARLNVPGSFGEVTRAEDVVFGAYDTATRSFAPSTVNVNAVRVTTRRNAERGNAAPRFLSSILGSGPVEIAATAIAARTITTTYGAPELFHLAPEAGDYNRIHAYCFDFAGSGPVGARRTQETQIAHNITPALTFVWPECPLGQSLSFRLYNVRDGRSNPTRRSNPAGYEYNYYSDTVVTDGRETFDFGGLDILETVRCDTLQECRPTTQGGVVPAGRNRTPQHETRPCVPGKFMYFGWEDRPPGIGAWTDTDYDDIVFVMQCPTGRDVAYGTTRLVR